MSLNKVMLIGNLGQDPEVYLTKAQQTVCTFGLATHERVRDLQGAFDERTEWHSIVTFGKAAITCSKYLRKGSKVYVEGKLRTSSYTDSGGVTKKNTKVLPSTVTFLDKFGAGTDSPEVIEITPDSSNEDASDIEENMC